MGAGQETGADRRERPRAGHGTERGAQRRTAWDTTRHNDTMEQQRRTQQAEHVAEHARVEEDGQRRGRETKRRRTYETNDDKDRRTDSNESEAEEEGPHARPQRKKKMGGCSQEQHGSPTRTGAEAHEDSPLARRRPRRTVKMEAGPSGTGPVQRGRKRPRTDDEGTEGGRSAGALVHMIQIGRRMIERIERANGPTQGRQNQDGNDGHNSR